MRILVLLPVLDAGSALDLTLSSLAAQAGPFRLIIRAADRGSRDGSPARLAAWAERLAAGQLPLLTLTRALDWAPAPADDRGRTPEPLGAALERAAAAVRLGERDLVTWLTPGDVLMPGALALAAGLAERFAPFELGWFGTTAAASDPGALLEDAPRPPLTTQALASGEAGLPPAGVFWRRRFWPAAVLAEASPEASPEARPGAPPGASPGASPDAPPGARPDTPAGTPEEVRALAALLWQALARQVAFVQLPHPLAQLGPVWAAAPTGTAPAAAAPAGRRRHLLPTGGEAGGPAIFEQSPGQDAGGPGRRIWPGRAAPTPLTAPPRDWPRGITGFDALWQAPALTEALALQRMAEGGPLPAGWHYVGFPFATLIDKLQTGAADADRVLAAWADLARRIPPGERVVTTCQHIHLRRHLGLMQAAGITDVFWSHATRADQAPGDQPGPRLRPFPLYPVQVPGPPPPLAAPQSRDADAAAPRRRWLYSFVGARGDQHYLTPVRRYILDQLAGDPAALIEGRADWHYQNWVYRDQVAAEAADPGSGAADRDPGAAAERPDLHYGAVMADSLFALCPSGTGPNTIRLWEALAAGAIPVVLSDRWAPPGDPALWQAGTIRVPETAAAVAALPATLAALAADPARIAALRAAGHALWDRYGPTSFVTDIRALIGQPPDDPAPAPVSERPSETRAEPDRATAAAQLLSAAARALLMGRPAPAPDQALLAARLALPIDHPAVRLYDQSLDLAAPAART
jgi:hypothetical protein